MTADSTIRAEAAKLHRDGKPINGGIHLSAEVHCAVCEDASLGLAYPIREAERELREGGWTIRVGLWVCPRHGRAACT